MARSATNGVMASDLEPLDKVVRALRAPDCRLRWAIAREVAPTPR